METDKSTAGDDKYLKQNDSNIEIEYKLPKEGDYQKFTYDGVGLALEIKLGDIKHYRNDGLVDVFTGNRIELHFPAEHYITIAGQTPRACLELQIHHTKSKTLGDRTSTSEDKGVRTNRAIISILYNIGETLEGDMFLNQMGISKFNTNNAGEYNIPKPNQQLDRNGTTPASYGNGFNFLAFQGLIYALNFDRHILFYNGSETSPPCREDAIWMVFAERRSISYSQFEFLNSMLTKNKNKEEVSKAMNSKELYGNKRNIKIYNESLRGKILSSQNGLKSVTGTSFFSEEPEIANTTE